MERKIFIKGIFTIFVLICVILVSCNYEINNSKIEKIKDVPIIVQIPSYSALVDNSIIYLDIKKLTYYRYNIDSDELTIIDKTENFYLSTKNTVLMNGKLYFYVNVVLNEDTTSNVLFEINLSDNKLKKYENHDDSLAGILTYKFGNEIITLKNIVSDEFIFTYLELFNPVTETWQVENFNTYNKNEKTGEAIHGLYSNDENLYVLHDEWLGENNVITTLKIYDNNLNEIQSLTLDKELYDYITEYRIIEMAVFGEYVYMINISNYAALGKIVNNTIIPEIMERNLTLALNQEDTNNPFFYTRLTKKCYTIDKNREITEVNLKIKNDEYSIRCILANKDNIFLMCYADDKKDYMYFIDKAYLDSVIIPCE